MKHVFDMLQNICVEREREIALSSPGLKLDSGIYSFAKKWKTDEYSPSTCLDTINAKNGTNFESSHEELVNI